jgi:uncharacterized protein
MLLCSLLFVALFLMGMNNPLKLTQYEISSTKLPKEFDGFVIVQLSDFHCKQFGQEQQELLQRIEKEAPELIVLTGDVYDEKRWDYSALNSFLEGITKIAPVYAITGNHEYDDDDHYTLLKKLYLRYDVTLLNDEMKQIYKSGKYINLYGMHYRKYISTEEEITKTDEDTFNILLYHDPNQFTKLLDKNFHLILSGHTHGGVIRLPLLGGMIGTSYEFFPHFDYGYYEEASTAMIISSGLGDTDIPRFFNRPEIVKITLEKGE